MSEKTDQLVASRDLLFGDLPLAQWAATGNRDIPWNIFKDAQQSVEQQNIPEPSLRLLL